MFELEFSLIKTFGWSLYELDETDIQSLLPFVQWLTRRGEKKTTIATCDQVGGIWGGE